MDPKVTSDRPMKDPMGMDYVPVYSDGADGAGAGRILFYRDPERPWVTSDEPGPVPGTGRELSPVREGDPDAKGIAINPVMVQNTGVVVEQVTSRPLERTVRASGQVAYDERSLHDVTLKYPAWIRRLHVDSVGRQVEKGDPLVDVYSPELVSAQQGLLAAQRLRRACGGATCRQAQLLVNSSRQRLRLWDIGDKEISRISKRGEPRRRSTLRSPVEGVVTEKEVVEGAQVEAGARLMRIADVRQVSISAEIYPNELPFVQSGAEADVKLSYLPGLPLRGTVDLVQSSAQANTARCGCASRSSSRTRTSSCGPTCSPAWRFARPSSTRASRSPSRRSCAPASATSPSWRWARLLQPREVRLGVAASGYVEVLEGCAKASAS